MSEWTRRGFLTTLASGIAAVPAAAREVAAAAATTKGAASSAPTRLQSAAQGVKPLMVSSSNGRDALTLGMGRLRRGTDTLDAVLSTVNLVEDDPQDNSVGLGGLPNEDGVVELDASVMHGPTRRAGSVGSIRDIKNPSNVAKLVMERTDHVMLVGAGARRFAVAHGIETTNLLTEDSRRRWLMWKASSSANWAPGLDSPEWKERMTSYLPADWTPEQKEAELAYVRELILHPPTGTINCLALDEKGDISGCTTTSGLAWKIAGRVGDSPIIGAGLFVDNDTGAAGSTGRGEENIKVSGAHTIVEAMARGIPPTEACLLALERVARNYNDDKRKLGRFHLLFYALNKDGQHGGASLWKTRRGGRPATYAVHDGTQPRLVECAGLLEGEA